MPALAIPAPGAEGAICAVCVDIDGLDLRITYEPERHICPERTRRDSTRMPNSTLLAADMSRVVLAAKKAMRAALPGSSSTIATPADVSTINPWLAGCVTRADRRGRSR